MSHKSKNGLLQIIYSILFVCILIGGGTGSYLLFNNLSQSQEKINTELFTQHTTRIQNKLQERFEHYEDMLRSGVGLFAASKSVEYEEWKQFVLSSKLLDSNKEVLAMGVIWHVRPEELNDFLVAMQKDRPGFYEHDYPSSTDHPSDHYIITYLEPEGPNKAAIGLDIASENVRRLAAEASAISGKATLTSQIQLIQDAKKRSGFLLMLPAYRKNVSLFSPEDRMRNVDVWVYVPLVAEHIFSNLVPELEKEIDFQVYFGGSVNQDSLIFTTNPDMDLSNTHSSSVMLGQKLFKIYWKPTPYFRWIQNSTIIWIPIFCLIICGLISLLIKSFQIKNKKVSELANKYHLMFADSQSKLLLCLSNASLGIWEWDIANVKVSIDINCEKLLGYAPKELVASLETWNRIAHPDDKESVQKNLTSALADPKIHFDCYFRAKSKTGQWMWLRLRGNILQYDQNGKPMTMMGTLQDVTASYEGKLDKEKMLTENLKLIEEQRTKIGELEESVRMKNAPNVMLRHAERLREIAHDLNNSFGGIAGYASLLIDKCKDDEKTTKWLNSILSSIDRATLLSKEISDIAKGNREEESASDSVKSVVPTEKYEEPMMANAINEVAENLSKQATGLLADKTILVVDDEELLRDMLKELLLTENAKVYCAANGAEAVRLFPEIQANLSAVVSDVMMPVMDGITLYHEIRKILPDVPVIFSSGYVKSSEFIKIQNEPRVSLMTKPFRPEQLVDALTKAMT